MNNAQKLNAAMANVERAAARLQRAATVYGSAAPDSHQHVMNQQDLLEEARRYADALRSLARRARAKA